MLALFIKNPLSTNKQHTARAPPTPPQPLWYRIALLFKDGLRHQDGPVIAQSLNRINHLPNGQPLFFLPSWKRSQSPKLFL